METEPFRTGVIRAGNHKLGEQCCVRKNWQSRISISAVLHQHNRKHLCIGFMLRNYNVRKLQISLHCFPSVYVSSAYSHLYIIPEINFSPHMATGFQKSCIEIRRFLELQASYKKCGFICSVAETNVKFWSKLRILLI